jgi:Rad3-related DNA helicase
LEQIINGGIIIAFSNYDLLERTLKWASVLNKKVYFETKGGNIDDVLKQYSAEVENNTAFLFIIMKGRFS